VRYICSCFFVRHAIEEFFQASLSLSLSSQQEQKKKKIPHDTRVDACRALRDLSENNERAEGERRRIVVAAV